MVHLGLDLLQATPNLVITFLPDRRGAERIQQELAAHPMIAQEVEGRWRAVPVIGDQEVDLLDIGGIDKEMGQNFERCFETVLSETTGSWAVKPGLIIMDVS